MPVYDMSLRDFLKYTTLPQAKEKEELRNNKDFITTDMFSLDERFEMLKRINDGLIFMHKKMAKPHRDIKPRPCFENFHCEHRYHCAMITKMI